MISLACRIRKRRAYQLKVAVTCGNATATPPPGPHKSRPPGPGSRVSKALSWENLGKWSYGDSKPRPLACL